MNYFNDVISEEEFFIDVPDCIAEGNDYQETIEKAFKLTNGFLRLDAFSWTNEQGRYVLNSIVNGMPEKFSVEIISDYVDSKGLIKGLNEILESSGYEGDKKFCDINGEVADFGVAFISNDKEKQLLQQGLIWREQ